MFANSQQGLAASSSESERELFFRLLTHDDRNSYYIVSSDHGGAWSDHAYRKAALPYLGFDQRSAYYITHNGFSGKRRQGNQTRQLNSLFFDLDCHAQTGDAARSCIDAALAAIEGAVAAGDVPEPTMIVDSGRGLHLYYVLERSIPCRLAGKSPDNAKGIGLFNGLQRRLATVLQNAVSDVVGIEVDRKVFDFTRVARIPGTFNAKAGCFARIAAASEKLWSLSALASLVKTTSASPDTAASGKAKAPKGIFLSYNPLMMSRLAKVQALQEYRGFDCQGNRELMSFVFYNTAVQVYSRELARQRLDAFNARFKSPLDTKELSGIVSSVDKVVNMKGQSGYYLLGASKLIELLGLTLEEIDATQFFASKRTIERAQAKARTQEKRNKRNKRIVSLHKLGKFTQREIAAICSCSLRTVAGVLKAEGLTKCSKSLGKATTRNHAPLPRRSLVSNPQFVTTTSLDIRNFCYTNSSFLTREDAKICHTSLRVVDLTIFSQVQPCFLVPLLPVLHPSIT